jgi:thiamine kinase-like enzyme
VLSLLKAEFPSLEWRLELPEGQGQETYFAHGTIHSLFVKLHARVEVIKAMSEEGLTPPVLLSGLLGSGTPFVVQPLVAGRTPQKKDFQSDPQLYAQVMSRMQRSPGVRAALPLSDQTYKGAAQRALSNLRSRWNAMATQVPQERRYVEDALDRIGEQIAGFAGEGLVASHNDIANCNWILTPKGRVYLVDLEMMLLDDPALDLGAVLWWYYPPGARSTFLRAAGYDPEDTALAERMRVRMAMHCLRITLPRAGSFDPFSPQNYADALVDFKAAFEGRENPQGYM